MNNNLKLILPKKYFDPSLLKAGERVYFLAGPIGGGGGWQTRAIELLYDKDPRAYIVCPCTYNGRPEFWEFSNSLPDSDHTDRTLWERWWLEQSSWYGSIIFWLPGEDLQNPRIGGQYARDTRGEIGRWSTRSAFQIFAYTRSERPHSNPRLNMIVGADETFPGLSTIKKNLEYDHKGEYPVCPTLEETIIQAVRLGKKWNPQPMFNHENA